MPNWRQRLKGNLFLGYCAMVAQPAKKWFRSDGLSGEERFLRNYAGEGNVVTSEADRAVLAEASQCIQCGLCDASAQSTGEPIRPSQLCNATARTATHLPFARGALAALTPERMEGAEALCPRRVPLVRIARYLQVKLQEVELAKDGGEAKA
jgi:Na+-translocating ferredoxin:NAD+ oxidoreductase RnfC subunit